jgi:hypothetical protein
MSLLRLLAAGRSLVDPKDSASRYRMRQKIRLPKFGSAQNPFRARNESPAVPAVPGAIPSLEPRVTAANPAATGSPPHVHSRQGPENPTPGAASAPQFEAQVKRVPTAEEKAAARLKKTVRLPLSTPPARTAASASPASAQGGWRRRLRRLNPLGWWPRRRRGGASTQASGPGRRAVQCELSLDRVKVVRNDLSDTDVEIVQAKQERKPGPDAGTAERGLSLAETPGS